MRIYLITEACFHVSYLIDMLSKKISETVPQGDEYEIIIRDKNKLDKAKLDEVHKKMYFKKHLPEQEREQLEEAYGAKLSSAELALIATHGVPKLHPLSLPVRHLSSNLNSSELLDRLKSESETTELAAIIFLDCILKPRWLDIFKCRIVNGHSAILPHARGMHAIEQVAAKEDPDLLVKSAGATIHYIDEQVDIGKRIRFKPIPDLWTLNSIWQLKGASYLTAFELLIDYLDSPSRFTLTDGLAYSDPIGPEFKLKDFTPEVAKNAYSAFSRMCRKKLDEQKQLSVLVAGQGLRPF